MEPIDLLLFMVTVSETQSRGERESGWVGCATTAIVPSAIAITVMVLIESHYCHHPRDFPFAVVVADSSSSRGEDSYLNYIKPTGRMNFLFMNNTAIELNGGKRNLRITVGKLKHLPFIFLQVPSLYLIHLH